MKKKLLLPFLVLFVFVGSLLAEEISFWTTDEQPDRLAKQQTVADEFKKETGITVKIIPITEKDLGIRATAAYAANDLPDVIYFPLQYALPWAEAGILDTDADNDVVDELGVNTFASGALNMVKFDDNYAAVPVDGWTQMILYRKDLFKKNNLEAPTTYAKVLKAIKVLHNPPSMYGFVAATKVDEGFMSQVLEHVFLANGVTPVGKNGIAPLGKKAKESLEFYKKLAKASPSGELYWKQSRELYLAGKAAMIIWSPFILDELAGLRNSAPVTIDSNPQNRTLAKNTGIITNFSGPSNPKGATWGEVRYFGITTKAKIDAATKFIKFSMDKGYAKSLSIAPEGKFPVRRGDKNDPEKYSKIWSKLPVGVDRKAPLSELYAPAMIKNLVEGLNTAQRWGVKEGQLNLASKINSSRIINRVVREYLDDSITVDEAIKKLNSELKRIK